jgi:small-conductance mechanosensitive channel
MARMYNAQIAYEEALYHYETIDDPADPADINLTQSELNTAQLELAAAEQRLRDTKARLDTTEEPSPDLVAQVAAARAAVHVRQQKTGLLGERLARLEAAREVWRRRYRVLSGQADAGELRVWKQEAAAAIADLERQRRRETARLGELRAERQTLVSQIERARTGADASLVALREHERHLRELTRSYDFDRTTIEAAQQLNRWLIDDIHAIAARLPWLDRARESLKRAAEFWQFELFTVEDSPITLATLLTALLLLFLGWFGSRFLSRMLGRRLLPRLGLQTGATAALQTLTFYLLFVAFTLAALRMVNVPLTVFTVLGGALAIGVGFGSQNIVNNFISGLILLIEQPIKVDDLIEVDGTYGKVEQIGTRSTRVRTYSNIHIIVPNSTFLEKNVTNWTLSDNLVRVQVNIGVAYGSPVREVERLILQALSENQRIVDFPVPEVFFGDFGDNALAFHAYFWIKIDNQNDRRRIESDVRFRVDELFREANITIAFPQRDVHLDTLRPLDVRVVRDD